MFHFPNDADKTIKFWLLLSWSWFVTSSFIQLGLWISAVFFLHPKHKIDAVVILVLCCFVVAWGVISHICLSLTVQKKRSTKQSIRLLNVFLVYKMTVIFLNCAGVVLFSIWFFRYGYAGMFLFFPEAVTCQFFWKYGRVLKEVRKVELVHVAPQPVFVVSQHYRLPLNEDKTDLPLAPPSYREK
ncbi:hypothetical protein L596_009870 [Steinernema carpocapsae]|uniref:Uncharacterized protein n=1 Tax=Steinernema carpocapsae TaxID=34508 RepID=A0A4U5PH41_STECR|nr:hypothetical protein L596_009870 [Steinernema carpocapsae]